MSELLSMKNIGKEIARKLLSIGITTPPVLRDRGAKSTFAQLKDRYPNVCLVHLYVLQGAIDDIEYTALSEDVKRELKAFSDRLK